MLNRGVLIVRPKQPYLDWAARRHDSGLAADPENEQAGWLIPEHESDDQAWEIRQDLYTEVFERELGGWHTDESVWPRNRTFAMVKAWFDIEPHSVVEDLRACRIEDDEHQPGAAGGPREARCCFSPLRRRARMAADLSPP